MAANSALSLASLDFDGIFAAQKAFLASQSRFKDYNFDGANMTTLLSVLAHNTWLNSFYYNMVTAERFVDSAQLRDSIVSHAKELNYTPRSAHSATAFLNLTFPTTGITTLEIPKGTQFTALNATGNHKFVTSKNAIYKTSNNYFSISELPVYEGFYFTETFLRDGTLDEQRFLLSNPSIDIDSVTITVDEGFGPVEYTRATTLYSVGPESKIFFLQSTSDYKYELIFGNNIFGKSPPNAATIAATYRVTTGADGNGMESFTLDSDIGTSNGGRILTPLVIEATDVSDGGADPESLESIRYMSPRHYQTQSRAIVTSDYETLVLEAFPIVKDMHVYGGEDVPDEVVYGKVFLVASTVSGNPLSTVDKNSIKAYISNKNSLGLTPVMVDPDYLELALTIKVHVDFRNTTLTIPGIKALVSAGVESFNISNLQKFDKAFRQSTFTAYLNTLDSCILSTEVTRIVKKTVSPPLDTPYSNKVRYGNEIRPEQVTSTFFVAGGKEWSITDAVDGVTNNGSQLFLLENNPANINPNYSVIGSISYTTGALDIGSLTVTSFLGNHGIVFSANPVSQDVYATGSDVIELDTAAYTVEVVSD